MAGKTRKTRKRGNGGRPAHNDVWIFRKPDGEYEVHLKAPTLDSATCDGCGGLTAATSEVAEVEVCDHKRLEKGLGLKRGELGRFRLVRQT